MHGADALHAQLLDRIATADPAEELRAAALAYIEFAVANPHRWRLIFELRADEPEQAAHVQRRVDQLFTLIESLLAARRPNLRSEALRHQATALWAGVHGIAALQVADKLGWSGARDSHPVLDALLAPILAER